MRPFKTLLLLVFVSRSFNLKTPEDTAEETQHALCKVITQEIETSANATIKRQLKGVCTSNQIDRKFKQLERRLLQELSNIKNLISSDRAGSVKAQDYDYFNYDEKSLDQNVITVTEMATQDFSWSRREVQLNNTVHSLKGQQVYTYYWKLPHIQAILQNGVHLKSYNFRVLDHQLCLELYSKYLNSDYLAIRLCPNLSFSKKYKFAILEQFDSTRDLNSQAFGLGTNHEETYKVPYAKLQERNYLYNDSLLLKVTIYLNS